MRTSSLARRAILPAVVALILAGCTGDDPAPAAGPEESQSPAPAEGETPEPLPGASESPTEPVFTDESNVLTVAVREPSTLDPMRLQDPGSVLIARQIFEGLTRWNPETQEVEPAVAESWEVSKGGSKFTFTLRDDATFSDGSPVTAQDFQFAFNRIALKKNGSDLAYLLELVRGFNAVNAFGERKTLAGIQAPDEATLVITLSEPYQGFPELLTHPSLVPLEAESVSKKKLDDFLAEPLGNGPFKVARPFELGQPVLLEASGEFYTDVALEGIRFLPFPDAAASWIPFQEGEIDVAEVPTGRIDAAQEEFGDAGFQPLLVGSYYGFNLESSQIDEKRVRRAVNLAIDREAIAERVFAGTLTAPRGIVPAGMPGFEDDACSDFCAQDMDEAKRLVRKLEKADRRLDLQVTREQPQKRVAKAVEGDLEEAGFKVTTNAYPFPKYLELLSDDKQDTFRLGWIAEYPDPDVFLSALFDSSSPDNHTEFSSSRVDKLLSKARREEDADRRLELYRKAERKVLDEIPVAPLGSFVMHWVFQPEVSGVRLDAMGGFDAASVSIESDS